MKRHKWVGRRGIREGRDEGGKNWSTICSISDWLPPDENDGEELFHCTHDDGDSEDLDEEEARVALLAMESRYRSTLTPSRSEASNSILVRRRFVGYGGWSVGTLVGEEERRSVTKEGSGDVESAQWRVQYADGSCEVLGTAALDKGVADYLLHHHHQNSSRKRERNTKLKRCDGEERKDWVSDEGERNESGAKNARAASESANGKSQRLSKNVGITPQSGTRFSQCPFNGDKHGGTADWGGVIACGDVVGRSFPGFGYFLGSVESRRWVGGHSNSLQSWYEVPPSPNGSLSIARSSSSSSSSSLRPPQTGDDEEGEREKKKAKVHKRAPETNYRDLFERLSRNLLLPGRHHINDGGEAFELPDEIVPRDSKPRLLSPRPCWQQEEQIAADSTDCLYTVVFSDGDVEEYTFEEVVAMKASLNDQKNGPKMSAKIRRAQEFDVSLVLRSMARRGTPIEFHPRNPYRPTDTAGSKKSSLTAAAAARGVWALGASAHGAASSSSSFFSWSAWERYERCKQCRSVGACLEIGAKPTDLIAEFERGAMRVKDTFFRRHLAKLALRIQAETCRHHSVDTEKACDAVCQHVVATSSLDLDAKEEGQSEGGVNRCSLEEPTLLPDDWCRVAQSPQAAESPLAPPTALVTTNRHHVIAAAGGGGGARTSELFGSEDRREEFRAWVEESWEGRPSFLQRRSDVHWTRLELKYLKGVHVHDVEEGQYNEHRVIVAVRFSFQVRPPQWVLLTRLVGSSSPSPTAEEEEGKAPPTGGHLEDALSLGPFMDIMESKEDSGGRCHLFGQAESDGAPCADEEEYVINATLHEMILRSPLNKHLRLRVRARQFLP